MPVQSRKREAGAAGGRQPAKPVVLVMTVVPMVKSAGLAAQAGARGAATWAAPRVNGARAWTAPRIEQSGLVIRDTVAPRIHTALVATARRVDVPAPPPARPRWPGAVARTAMFVAAASTGRPAGRRLRHCTCRRQRAADDGLTWAAGPHWPVRPRTPARARPHPYRVTAQAAEQAMVE
jgi:hypothetical protein